MGVMSCSRKDCENIMCDTYIYSVGYICAECQSEFANGNSNLETEGEIMEALKDFMDSSKNTASTREMSVSEFFKQYS